MPPQHTHTHTNPPHKLITSVLYPEVGVCHHLSTAANEHVPQFTYESHSSVIKKDCWNDYFFSMFGYFLGRVLTDLHKLDAQSISGTMLMGHGEDLKDDEYFTWELNQFS